MPNKQRNTHGGWGEGVWGYKQDPRLSGNFKNKKYNETQQGCTQFKLIFQHQGSSWPSQMFYFPPRVQVCEQVCDRNNPFQTFKILTGALK